LARLRRHSGHLGRRVHAHAWLRDAGVSVTVLLFFS
jgi:hypothetical protein